MTTNKKDGEDLVDATLAEINDKLREEIYAAKLELAEACDKNKSLEHENHCLRVKVEQYRGKEEAFEFAFDKLVDKLGDR